MERYVLTKKTRYVGLESGKSSTRWFGPSSRPGTEAAKHGYGARAGDGKTVNESIVGKIVAKFKSGK
jgi:hypothetical protein